MSTSSSPLSVHIVQSAKYLPMFFYKSTVLTTCSFFSCTERIECQVLAYFSLYKKHGVQTLCMCWGLMDKPGSLKMPSACPFYLLRKAQGQVLVHFFPYKMYKVPSTCSRFHIENVHGAKYLLTFQCLNKLRVPSNCSLFHV